MTINSCNLRMVILTAKLIFLKKVFTIESDESIIMIVLNVKPHLVKQM